ncbi:hypothetical protein M408DRAFT_312429, partial [Serendipita vermifera MAFF 305830]
MKEVDCCEQSCMAFAGYNADLDKCRYCDQSRKKDDGKPRKTSFHYSLIDRLRGMYQDPGQSAELNRDDREPTQPDILADKFDGAYFQELKNRTVKVEGIDTGYQYFSDGRDISLTIALDGF